MPGTHDELMFDNLDAYSSSLILDHDRIDEHSTYGLLKICRLLFHCIRPMMLIHLGTSPQF